jgi:hypothetical protein
MDPDNSAVCNHLLKVGIISQGTKIRSKALVPSGGSGTRITDRGRWQISPGAVRATKAPLPETGGYHARASRSPTLPEATGGPRPPIIAEMDGPTLVSFPSVESQVSLFEIPTVGRTGSGADQTAIV